MISVIHGVDPQDNQGNQSTGRFDDWNSPWETSSSETFGKLLDTGSVTEIFEISDDGTTLLYTRIGETYT